MKTYVLICVFIACLVMGCSNEGVGGKDSESLTLTANYTVLLSKDGILQTTYLNADSEGMSINPATSDLELVDLPELTYRNGSKIGFLNSRIDCSAHISIHDFGDNTTANVSAFTEALNCDLSVKSMAFSDYKVFVAYTAPSSKKNDSYFIRILDVSTHPTTFKDIELQKEPRQLLESGNKIYLLVKDTYITDKYSLMVMDSDNGAVTHEINLGTDVLKIAKDNINNILVSYPNLHSLVDGNSMVVATTTNYVLGKEPMFGYSKSEFFGEHSLYYPMEAGSKSAYSHVAAVYDFKENISVLYIYENFLSQEERNLKYEIEDTTVVAYDSKNNLILIGYKKKGNNSKGGLMRIKPMPDPKFLDNVDLDGVPMELFPD